MSDTLLAAVQVANQRIASFAQRDQWWDDPAKWAWDVAGIRLWSRQRDIAQLLVDNRSVAVAACHGAGKSHLVAVLICWWIDTRYPNAFVASTAPSAAQISAIVWRYVRSIKNSIEKRYQAGLIDHELPGYITSDNQWKEDGGNLLGFGRKPPDNKEDDSFQGLHDAYVLAIGDEGVGLSKEIIDALGNITSNEDSRRILIANPTNPSSYMGRIFKESLGNWVTTSISAFDTPNFTDERDEFPDEVLRNLVGPSYVEDKKAEYGENSARYKSRVLGEFAWDLGDTLIQPEDVAVAYDTDITPLDSDRITLGVDISRFGSDLSVIYINHGGKVRFVKSFDKNSLTELVSWVHKTAVDVGAHEVRYDVAGVGQGFEELMWQMEPRPYKMIGMNPNEKSPDKRQWHNSRAWWWDSTRKMLRGGELDVDIADERVTDELMSVGYKFNATSGGLVLESKDDMKKRGMKSPDFADAFVYAVVDVEKIWEDEKSPAKKIYEDPSDILGDSYKYLDLLVQRPW